jgi:EpsI family protein
MNVSIKSVKYQFTILIVMVIAALTAMQMHPTHKIADEHNQINLEAMLPKQFDGWVEDVESGGYIVNPTVEQNLKNIYSQTLNRTYVNQKGNYVMLSVAYGEEQSDTKRLHYPEFCYPAQGFQIDSSQRNVIHTNYGNIRVKQLLAIMGTRSEPITYWSTVGDKVVMAGREAKIEQLKYGFKGEIPDGLLFRVSSITKDTNEGYALHQAFIRSLISSVSKESRLRLAGLSVDSSISH